MKRNAHTEHYRSDEEVVDVVRKFESCEFRPDDFKHRAHLTVALCYLLREPEDCALRMMRKRILRFLEYHAIETTAYHETMTIFWIKRVRAFIDGVSTDASLSVLANELIEYCGNSGIIYDFYTEGLIRSDAARLGWVAPDLKPLDF